MKIILPSYELVTPIDRIAILKRIEECGRVCYQSEHKITGDSYKDFIKKILKRGHEAVLEHVSLTIKIICDRGVSHEIVRHRIASYCQESTRYCNYSDDKFDNEITVVKPCFWLNAHGSPVDYPDKEYFIWSDAMLDAERRYFELLKLGTTPQEARSVLPNSLKTEIIITMNIREWRHFFRLRTALAAHPQMREITIPLLQEMKWEIPELFGDIQIEGETENKNV